MADQDVADAAAKDFRQIREDVVRERSFSMAAAVRLLNSLISLTEDGKEETEENKAADAMALDAIRPPASFTPAPVSQSTGPCVHSNIDVYGICRQCGKSEAERNAETQAAKSGDARPLVGVRDSGGVLRDASGQVVNYIDPFGIVRDKSGAQVA